MTTYNTNVLPNTTGLDLGSDIQRWDGFFNNLTVTGSLNGGLSSADSVQILTTSQTLGYAGAVHTLILATGSGGGITLALPIGISGRRICVKKTDISIGNVNISGSIEGSGTYVLSNQYQYVTLESSDGTSWWVVANN
jgi:hypothetical protein